MGYVQPFFLDGGDIVEPTPRKPRKRSGSKSSSGRKQSTKKPVIRDCSTCKLDQQCRTPEMDLYGEGGAGIMIVSLRPGLESDREGRAALGSSWLLIGDALRAHGFNLRKDCISTNLVLCRPPFNPDGTVRDPSAFEIECCTPKLHKDISDIKPKVIIAFGSPALQAVAGHPEMPKFSVTNYRGRVLPIRRWNAWVGCSFHPRFVRMTRDDNLYTAHEEMLIRDVGEALKYLNEPLPEALTEDGNIWLKDAKEARDYLYKLADDIDGPPVTFDYETNSKDPFEENLETLSVSFATTPKKGYGIALCREWNGWSDDEQDMVEDALCDFLTSARRKVVQNSNYEQLWSSQFYGCKVRNVIHDTMLGNHVVYCRKGCNGLDEITYALTGITYKKMVDIRNLKAEPPQNVINYNCFDVRYQIMGYKSQRQVMEKPQKDFYVMCNRSLPTLARMSNRGTRIDVPKLKGFQESCAEELDTTTRRLMKLDCVHQFEKKNNKTLNLNAKQQIASIVFDILGEKPTRFSKKTENRSMDKKVVEELLLDHKHEETKEFLTLLDHYNRYESFRKLIKNWFGLIDPNGFLHPLFKLHVARTYRSSSTNPNFQNIPKHDELLKSIRSCIIPRDGGILLEVDYSACEVCVLAMASQDPVLYQQIVDQINFHRYWASRIYMKPESEIDKDTERYKTKNAFVFASFYGSRPESIARNFPELQASGLVRDVKEHFREIQAEFWDTYKLVRKWQQDTIRTYIDKGYVEAISGFRRPGPLTIEKLYNTPIQGPAFHLLLNGLYLSDNKMWKAGMKSVPIIEVHDSTVFDAREREKDDVVELVSNTLTSRMFDWQGKVPLTVEWEEGYDWYNMKELVAA